MKAKIQNMLLMKKPMTEVRDVIAKYLISKYKFKTIPGIKSDEIYVYEDGIYVKKGKDIIEEEAEKILEEVSSSHMVKEIKNKIERLTKISRKNLQCKDKNLICVKNGVLDLTTKKIYEHSESYKFMNKLDINYNSTAQSNEIFNFLYNILNEKDVDCIQEWFGYQLYREYFIKKAIIIRGVPDTGKTTFINLLKRFIGEDNCSSVSLQLLAQGKWQLVPLLNKYSNICDDLSPKDVEDAGTFKQVTGRSPIRAEIKFGDGFDFENYAKLTFACNKIPIIKSDIDDQAHWDRWMIIDFENVFDKKNKTTDNKLIHKLTTEYELSGLLNWAIEGLDRLMKRGYFSYRRDWERNRKIMQGEASSVSRFVSECLLYEIDSWISNKEVYDSYYEYCILNSITAESDQKFAKDIRLYCNFGVFNSNRKGAFGIKGIKVKKVLPIGGIKFD